MFEYKGLPPWVVLLCFYKGAIFIFLKGINGNRRIDTRMVLTALLVNAINQEAHGKIWNAFSGTHSAKVEADKPKTGIT